jgi:hypothetical protein
MAAFGCHEQPAWVEADKANVGSRQQTSPEPSPREVIQDALNPHNSIADTREVLDSRKLEVNMLL